MVPSVLLTRNSACMEPVAGSTVAASMSAMLSKIPALRMKALTVLRRLLRSTSATGSGLLPRAEVIVACTRSGESAGRCDAGRIDAGAPEGASPGAKASWRSAEHAACFSHPRDRRGRGGSGARHGKDRAAHRSQGRLGREGRGLQGLV